MMCRLPIEVMSMIIHHLKRPLPPPGDDTVTWKDLHQHDLTKMMRVSRMAMFITAPLLYKEVVVDHCSAFLYDNNVSGQLAKDDHERPAVSFANASLDDLSYVSDQQPIPATDANATLSSRRLYSKPELLAMTETVHLVYSIADGDAWDPILYFNPRQDFPEPDVLYDSEHFARYDVAGQVDPKSDRKAPFLPKLQRCTFGSWNRNLWEVPDTDDDSWLESSSDYEIDLASQLEPFHAPATCHWAVEGPFARRSQMRTSKSLQNAIHGLCPEGFRRCVIPAIRNTVFFPGDVTPLADVQLEDDLQDLRVGIEGLCLDWQHCRRSKKSIDKTQLVFCFERASGASQLFLDEAIDVIVAILRYNGFAPTVSVTWADEQPPCAACGHSYTSTSTAFGELATIEDDESG